MKTKLTIIFTLLCTQLFFSCGSGEKENSQSTELEGNISLSGAFALYPMAMKWAQEFQKVHPKVHIDVSGGGAGKGMADMLTGNATFGMVSRDISPAEIEKGAYQISVCKDAVLPTISSKNPYLKDLFAKGVKQSVFREIYVTGKANTWGHVLTSAAKEKVELFTRSDASGAAETWAKYLGKNQEDLNGLGAFGDPGIAEGVKKNPFSLGYNNVVYVYDLKSKKAFDGISPLPIDIDSNGLLDEHEKFYGSLDEIMDAISKGKYPSPPSRELFLVTNGKPTDKIAVAFLEWILTDGQKYVSSSGYISLTEDRIKEQITRIK